MKALSIQQPWANLIIHGFPLTAPIRNADGTVRLGFSGKVLLKNIENRTWPIVPSFRLPQRIVVHAGKKIDSSCIDFLMRRFQLPYGPVLMYCYSKVLKPYLGALIGEVDVIGCITESKNPWFCGPYGFVLANSKPYEKPVPYPGQLGFFEVPVQSIKENR